MFSISAKWYDAIYRFKNYCKESDAIMALIKEKHPAARTILDIACGTAEHDRYLTQKFQVDGLDISPEFIAIARDKNPTGSYFVGDMVQFSLKRRYDVILCLFSSIGYVRTIQNARKAIQCFAAHLNEQGIILLEPWFTNETWITDGTVHMLNSEIQDQKICRMSLSKKKGNLSIIDFHYLIGANEKIRHFQERHELGLFSHDEILDAFTRSDLDVEYDADGLTGRGLYMARAK